MAQDITLLGASYPDVPAVLLPKTGGGTAQFVDISGDTVTAAHLEMGYTAHDKDGNPITGTLSPGGGGTGAVIDVVEQLPGGGEHHIITGVDISGDTVTAAHLETGYTAHDAEGNAITGTLEPGGGGGGSVSPKQVNFLDYDGTVLYSYTAAEAQALSELPANPSHSGLTAQGWNWTLAQIKAQLTAMPDGPVWVGQMYITQSGDTEIDVRMPEGRLSPILTIAVNGTVTVDWGDGTTADTATGTSLTTRQAVPHTYAAPGDYTIVIHTVSGSFTFYGSSSYTILRKNTAASENRVYSNCVQAVRLGSGITIIDAYAFAYCYSIASITIPNSVTSIGNYAFQYCFGLSSVTIPSGVTSIGNYAFQYCYNLASVTIPSGVTSIGDNAFNSCYSLASITIPSGVTSIGNQAFQYCYGAAEYHILPATPPTAGTTIFVNIVSDCVIYVPAASLTDYQTATNWSTYASKMQGE